MIQKGHEALEHLISYTANEAINLSFNSPAKQLWIILHISKNRPLPLP
jgi:hypothetical protein